jgi:sugar O-acyltransferase (sialic acid O-acetyltransferase NeuD family)
MKKIAIIGAGGLGREVKMLIDQINKIDQEYEILGFYDDGISRDAIVNGYKVHGIIDELLQIDYQLSVVIAIANPAIKKNIYTHLSDNPNLIFPTLIHPNVLVGSDNVTIGNGCIICASNIITVNVTIGNFVTLNFNCSIAHDTIIGDFCSVMPGVCISGDVTLKDLVYLGSGATIINLITVGCSSTVGAGVTLSKNLPDNSKAIGIPPKTIANFL